MAHCGAKTRSGEPCKRHPVAGSKRCKLHGGLSTGAPGNKNAAKPGSIYSKFLTDEENEALSTIELGRVDDELKLTRIRLMRALARENELGDTAELESERHETLDFEGASTGDQKLVTSKKVRDYAGLIDKLTARIESLERTRAELLKNNPPEQAPVARIEIEVVGGRTNAQAHDDGAAS